VEPEAFLFAWLVVVVRVVQRFRAPTIDLLAIKKPSETISFCAEILRGAGRREISRPTESRSFRWLCSAAEMRPESDRASSANHDVADR
jgi:hypothetical protein